MVSCQVQRAAFPTALGMSAMAAALWKREQSFDQVSDRYLKDVFDSDWEVMKEYFKNLSEWFHPPYLRLEEEQVSSKQAKDFAMLSDYLKKSRPGLGKKKNRRQKSVIGRLGNICAAMLTSAFYWRMF